MEEIFEEDESDISQESALNSEFLDDKKLKEIIND